MLVLEPQILEHVVRLVEKLAVETIKITKVMRVEFLSAEGLDHGGDAGAFVAHGFRVKTGGQVTSDKLCENACVGRAFSLSLVAVTRHLHLLRNESEETAAVGGRDYDFILQVG